MTSAPNTASHTLSTPPSSGQSFSNLSTCRAVVLWQYTRANYLAEAESISPGNENGRCDKGKADANHLLSITAMALRDYVAQESTKGTKVAF
jgi:hypothetical protein